MRPSPLRHNLARLRTFLDLHQQEMADAVGCSRELIKSVELGRTHLTERLAQAIFMATGVSMPWLLNNDLKAEMVDHYDRPYTRAAFNEAKGNDTPFEHGYNAISRWTLSHQFESLFACYLAAEKKGVKHAMLFRLRLSRIIEALERDFGWDCATYDQNDVRAALCEAIGGRSPVAELETSRRRTKPGGGRKTKAG